MLFNFQGAILAFVVCSVVLTSQLVYNTTSILICQHLFFNFFEKIKNNTQNQTKSGSPNFLNFFQKNLKKSVDKSNFTWYYNQADW